MLDGIEDPQNVGAIFRSADAAGAHGVIRQARARNKDAKDGGHVWIIVLTNYDLPTVRERCMQAGADHFLDKMREIDQLIPILLGIAGRKP